MNKYMIVSIHDCAPIFQNELERITSALDTRMDDYSVLVTPYFHNSIDIRDAPDFLGLIKSLDKDVVMHGYNHKSEITEFDSVLDKLYVDFRFRGQTEFHKMSKTDIEARIAKSKIIFEDAGLEASGFISPCWTMDDNLESSLRENGFGFYTRRDNIHYLGNMPSEDKVIDSHVLQFTSRSGLCHITKPFNAYIKATTNPDIVRIPIHPQNLEKETTFQYFLKTVDDHLDKGFEPISYSNLRSKL